MFRPFEESDKALLIQAHRADPWHADEDDPAFYWEPGTIITCHGDAQGLVFFMRTSGTPPLMRLDIQFCPVQKRRIAAVMASGWPGVKQSAIAAGFREVEFFSRNQELQEWTRKNFGFEYRPPGRMVLTLQENFSNPR